MGPDDDSSQFFQDGPDLFLSPKGYFERLEPELGPSPLRPPEPRLDEPKDASLRTFPVSSQDLGIEVLLEFVLPGKAFLGVKAPSRLPIRGAQAGSGLWTKGVEKERALARRHLPSSEGWSSLQSPSRKEERAQRTGRGQSSIKTVSWASSRS
jgi:hypothetical protein